MAKILVSGLVNTETTVRVRKFPVEYYPIDYPFFGIASNVSGVAYNIAAALKTLGDSVEVVSMVGKDLAADYVEAALRGLGVSVGNISRTLQETPSSVVLYDGEGKRQIYCDLKDVQEQRYECKDGFFDGCDLVVACNVDFNRQLLQAAKSAGKTIATDVHVLCDIDDEYNRGFMAAADILFLSDEGLPEQPRDFLRRLAERYGNKIIVLGRGGNGAMMYVSAEDKIYDMPCVKNRNVVNTVGAGDALFSCFVHCHCKGLPPQDCLGYAQVFASHKIGYNGASVGFMGERDLLAKEVAGTRG